MKIELFGIKAIANNKLYDLPASVWHKKESVLDSMFDYFKHTDPDYYKILTTKSVWLQLSDGQASSIDGSRAFNGHMYFDAKYQASCKVLQNNTFWRLKVYPSGTNFSPEFGEYLVASGFKKDAKNNFILVKGV